MGINVVVCVVHFAISGNTIGEKVRMVEVKQQIEQKEIYESFSFRDESLATPVVE